MKKKIKKIIAREFLLILFGLTVFLITLISSNFLNSKNGQKIKSLSNENAQLNMKIILPNKVYLNGLFDYLGGKEILKENKKNWIKKIESNDSEKRNIFNALGGEKELRVSFTVWNTKVFGTEKNNRKLNFKITTNNEKIKNLENSLFHKKIDQLKFLSVIIFLLFGLRYLIYMTSWSIKQLKD